MSEVRTTTIDAAKIEELKKRAPTSKPDATTYVVLRLDESGLQENKPSGWVVENSNVPASNAEAAVRLACKTDSAPSGTYVAIPARSWKPVTVKAEQTVVLKLESAEAKS